MATSPHLSLKLREALGNEAGEELVRIVDKAASDIADVRGDIAELRHETRSGFARIDARFEQMDAKFNATLEKALRDQTRFFFLAWSVLLAAIVGLYAR